MAEKKVTYREPAGYFSPAMKKAVKEYDRKQKESNKSAKKGKK